jgi:pimeloyl-ACP methyl ester carboxylesterase
MEWPSNIDLVLLPGLDGTGILFEPFINEFPNRGQLKVISYPSRQNLNYKQLAELVRSQLPESRDFVLLAESFSGPVAARLIEHPRLAAIIFCASFLRCPRPNLMKFLSLLPLSLLFRIPLPAAFLRVACFGKDCPEHVIALFRRALKEVDPRVLESRFTLLRDTDDYSRVNTQTVPCCYLLPSKDKLVPPANVEEMKQAIASMLIIRVAGPHFLLQASPRAAIDSICMYGQENLTREKKE